MSSRRSGQGNLFIEIWNEREHVSEISGKPLIENMNHDKFWWQFSHVLAKGKYPALKFSKKNIKLLTWEEHQLLTEHPGKAKELPEWKEYFEYYDKLRSEYYERNNV